MLEAYGYQRLGYIDIQGLLQNMPLLEKINIETKDAAIGSDQLQPVLHPRLKELGVRGSRLRSISSGTLSGLKGKEFLKSSIYFMLIITTIYVSTNFANSMVHHVIIYY